MDGVPRPLFQQMLFDAAILDVPDLGRRQARPSIAGLSPREELAFSLGGNNLDCSWVGSLNFNLFG